VGPKAKRRQAWLLLLFVGGVVPGLPRLPSSAGAGEAPDRQREQARIAALLDAVERSAVKFIREGKEYSAKDARKHLERKLRYAGDGVKTAEQFIEGIASHSSTTGRPYFIRLPSGERVESGPWMQQRLAEIDARR
jgi:hypothetical protein